MQNEQRFHEIINEMLALAAEADIRSNDRAPGYYTWRTLAKYLWGAAHAVAEDRMTDEAMRAAAYKAIERIADDEPITVREMVEP